MVKFTQADSVAKSPLHYPCKKVVLEKFVQEALCFTVNPYHASRAKTSEITSEPFWVHNRPSRGELSEWDVIPGTFSLSMRGIKLPPHPSYFTSIVLHTLTHHKRSGL